VTGNLGKLGLSLEISKTELLEMHYSAIVQVIGEKGTLVVPTHSFSLCNKDIAFDLAETKSEMGPFTEFVRNQPGSIRQFHPFSSRVAVGAKAEFICQNNSRHSYGKHTPFARMLECDAKFISIGIEPRNIVSLIHQCELEMGVPYRYTKEFMHPVIRNGVEMIEPFYHFVTYLKCDIERDKNKKFFERFTTNHKLHETNVGKGKIWSFSMREFYESSTALLCEDIYAWLANKPEKRPFQN
jgi:aminoglycoside 3-N-acetyltransferase